MPRTISLFVNTVVLVNAYLVNYALAFHNLNFLMLWFLLLVTYCSHLHTHLFNKAHPYILEKPLFIK